MIVFAFIFARGGSKGLPNKNLKILGGMPLIAHSINFAKELDLIDEVFVSSESEDILRVAQEYGAQTIIRPQELAQDQSSEWLAWQHAITHLSEKNIKFDKFLSLPATAPLRSSSDVLKCFDMLGDGVDMVLTASEANRNPFFNMIYREEDGTSRVLLDSPAERRQDAPLVYDLTTVAYLTSPQFIQDNKGVFDGTVKSVIIPKERSIDIDDEIDFLLTRTIYEDNH